MGRRKKSDNVKLNAEEIQAWAENIGGMKPPAIAEKHGVSLRTAYNWIDRAKERINPPNIDEIRGGLFEMTDAALAAIDSGLTNCDPKDRAAIALRLLSGLSVLSEKSNEGSFTLVIQDERHKQLATGLSRFGYIAPQSLIEGGGVPGEGGDAAGDGTPGGGIVSPTSDSDDSEPCNTLHIPDETAISTNSGNGIDDSEISEPNDTQEVN